VNVAYKGGDFIVNVRELGKSGKYYVYGVDETEAGNAVGEMLNFGFKNVINLGSFEDAQRILPLGVTP
jgi:hypothetical protein